MKDKLQNLLAEIEQTGKVGLLIATDTDVDSGKMFIYKSDKYYACLAALLRFMLIDYTKDDIINIFNSIIDKVQNDTCEKDENNFIQ